MRDASTDGINVKDGLPDGIKVGLVLGLLVEVELGFADDNTDCVLDGSMVDVSKSYENSGVEIVKL